MCLHVAWIMDGLALSRITFKLSCRLVFLFSFHSLIQIIRGQQRGKRDGGEEWVAASESGKQQQWWKALVILGE